MYRTLFTATALLLVLHNFPLDARAQELSMLNLHIPPVEDCSVSPTTIEELRERLASTDIPQSLPPDAYRGDPVPITVGTPVGFGKTREQVAAFVWEFFACVNHGPTFDSQMTTDHYLADSWDSLAEFDAWVTRQARDEQGLGYQLSVDAMFDIREHPGGFVSVQVLESFVVFFTETHVRRDQSAIRLWLLPHGESFEVDGWEVVDQTLGLPPGPFRGDNT